MKAFWWFEDNAIAGMARPGFNHVQWFDLPFDEAMIMGWLGSHTRGSASLDSFRKHLQIYPQKIFRFYNLDEKSGPEALKVYDDREKIKEIIKRLAQRTRFIGSIELDGDTLHFEPCNDRLKEEIDFIKEKGIQRIVTLTEHHHAKEVLQDHFTLNHLAIEDLGAPDIKQVEEFAKVIQEAKQKNEKLAVHCLAGIGRTSTMLMGAHLLLGEDFDKLATHLKQRNPTFHLLGTQGEFLLKIREDLKRRS